MASVHQLHPQRSALPLDQIPAGELFSPHEFILQGHSDGMLPSVRAGVIAARDEVLEFELRLRNAQNLARFKVRWYWRFHGWDEAQS